MLCSSASGHPTRTGRAGPSQPVNEAAVPPVPPGPGSAASEVVPRCRPGRLLGAFVLAGVRPTTDCEGPTPDELPEGVRRRLPRRRAGQPALPADRGSGAGLLGRRRHVPRLGGEPAVRRERRERVRVLRRPAVRQRPPPLRPPAHRLRQGPDPALPDDARPPGRAPVRVGHPRAACRTGGHGPAGHQDQRGNRRARHREVQRRVPPVGAALHPGMAGLRHPAGPLGRFRARLQDAGPDLHGKRHVGVQAAAREGPGLRGLPLPAVLLERRDPAVRARAAHGRRRLPAAEGPGGHGRAAAGDRRAGAGLDDHAVDAAVQPGHGRAPGRGLRGGRVGRDRAGRALPAGRGPAAGLRSRAGRGRGVPDRAPPQGR